MQLEDEKLETRREEKIEEDGNEKIRGGDKERRVVKLIRRKINQNGEAEERTRENCD